MLLIGERPEHSALQVSGGINTSRNQSNAEQSMPATFER